MTVLDPTERDDTSRLLAAAAHLDRRFADTAIREFLTEPRRAVPASPGVDARYVLRECLAARRRRQWRDGGLVVLTSLFLRDSPWLFLGWLLAALGWRAFAPHRRRLDGRSTSVVLRPRTWLLTILAGLVLVALLSSLLDGVFAPLVRLSDWVNGYLPMSQFVDSQVRQSTSWLGFDVSGTALFIGALILYVILFDRYAVWYLATHVFSPDAVHRSDTHRSGFETFLRNFGTQRYAARLTRIQAGPTANVIVYRGNNPFIGGGVPQHPWSLTIPLQPTTAAGRSAPGIEPPDVMKLYEHVAADLLKLKNESSAFTSSSLSPSARIGGLTQRDQLIVLGSALEGGRDEAERAMLLPEHDGPATQRLPDDVVASVARHPREWLRYYSCFRIESWDRSVVTSLYLHFGLDQSNMYIECAPTTLFPLNPQYRWVDGLSASAPGPLFFDALGSAITLPLTIAGRALNMWSGTRPPPARTVRRGERFGATMSLREAAAANEFDDYLQEADAKRYQQILQLRLFKSLESFLTEHGFDSSELSRWRITVLGSGRQPREIWNIS